MKRLFLASLFIIISLIVSPALSAQDSGSDQVKIFGKVTSTWTGEGMGGVSIYIESIRRGTSTDEDGNYSLNLARGTYTIRFSRVGLKSESKLIAVVEDVNFNIELKEEIYSLEEIAVYSERLDANVEKPNMGKATINTKILTSMPAFLGEADVIKTITFLPGVSTVGEGAAGFNVRGGGVDQNLILQDGALIFNSSHVFGFFSSFNPVMVNKATLYKSGLHARYGGRLSSVLDVDLKEGNYQQYSVNGGIGLVASKLAIDGPILKNKLSFIAATRVSYSDYLLKVASNPDVRNSSAAFQDVNFKLTYRMNDNNKFRYSGYLSNDKFALASDTTFAWSTLNHSVQWTHTFSEKLVLYADLINGSYQHSIADEEGLNSFDVQSEIGYSNAKLNFEWDASEKHQVNFGGEAILYDFKPGERKPLTAESGVEPLKLEHEKSEEISVYAEDEITFSERLSIRAGLRFGMFRNFGAGSDFIYNSPHRSNADIIDTVYYDNRDVIASYSALEPRVSLSYKVTETSSVKASYNRTRQYLHLITNTAAVTPVDLWKTSNKYIQPETGDQVSIGYYRNFKNNTYETSAELYYKLADNIVEFKDGTILLMNENIEGALINGTSTGYGAEFFVNKKTGRVTGWMSYTFSRIFREVNGEFSDEKINNGKKYPANNDKPHAVNITMNYKQSPVVEFGANFTYSTGRPSTVPLSLYDVSNQSNVFNFSARNQGRIPDYHRLDVSMTVNSKPRVNRKWELSWTFAVYNLYGRKNAYSVFYENMYGFPPKAYKLSVLGSAFPSIMLNFKF